jgi:uncharacterized Zn ribbon protein
LSVGKVGTKVNSIHLIDDEHDIGCGIAGIGAMQLMSEFAKKA